MEALKLTNSVELLLVLTYPQRMRLYHKLLCMLLPILCTPLAQAHGGVSLLEDETCVINIGFLTAHFTVFQPRTSGTKEFCEDLPKATETIFVLDYLHEYLKQMRVEFRIIKDVNNYGVFATWDDVQKMGDLSDETVFLQEPTVNKQGIYTVNHTFVEPGMYIGIITAYRNDVDLQYRTVFPFKVGSTNWGLIPLFVVLIVAAQFAYLYFNKRSNSGTA